MERHTIQFCECEHEGDLDHYVNDLMNSGAEIIDFKINYDTEICQVSIEFKKNSGFMRKFRETRAYNFIN